MITLRKIKTLLKLQSVSTTLDSLSISKRYYCRGNTNKTLFGKQNCFLLTRKPLSTDVPSVIKVFNLAENAYAHSVFEKLPAYSENLAPSSVENVHVMGIKFVDLIKKDWTQESVDAVYSGFENMSHYLANNSHNVCSDEIVSLCENVIAKCRLMSDENLMGVLCCLRLWPVPLRMDIPIFTRIWNAIDDECVKRIKNWDIDKVLYVSDHWYKLHLAPKTKFIWHGNLKLGKRPTRLSPHQLILCMFYINVYQKWHPAFIKYEFEYSVQKCLDKLTIDEIGIFGMTFSKWQIRIYSADLISEVLARIMNEVNTVHDVTLTAILRALRNSITPSLSEMLYEFLNKLASQVSRLSLASLVHVALAGTSKSIQVFHEDLMQSISKRFCREMSSARLKDLERLSFALTQYDFVTKTGPSVYRLILEELKNPNRNQESLQFLKSLPRCLYYLSIKNVYDLNLIDYVLGEEYIRSVYGKKEYSYGLELLGLDTGVEIECQEYKGNRLSARAREIIAKRHVLWIPPKDKRSHSNFDKFLFEVLEILENILEAPDTLYAVHILPHHDKADIVFGIKADGQPLKIPAEFKELSVGSLKPPPTSNCETTWYAVIIGGWNLMITKEKRPVGPVVSKMRQLKALGYTPVLIPWFEWCDLKADEKKQFLSNLLARKKLVKSVSIN